MANASLVAIHKAVYKLSIVVQVVGGTSGHRVILPRPVGRSVEARDDLQPIGLTEIDDLVVLGPAKLAWTALDLLPQELLLGPHDARFTGHTYGFLALPRFDLAFQEKVRPEGVQVGTV